MSLPWTPEQREWLQALGHPAMLLAGDGSIAGDAGPASITPAEADRAATGTPGRTSAPAEDSVLHRALLKATGLPGDQAGRVLASMGIDAAALRDDPAAKRRLWPQLRRLRKGPAR